MTVKPWREVATPHKDVLQGTFQQAEFAADISQVAAGAAPQEYQQPDRFFARTYITEGLQLLLMSVAQRLAGKGGDPVVQLQTAFGGGKTHAMLAVYHLAQQKVSTSNLAGIPPVLDKAGIHELSPARVAVIDGIKLSASEPRQYNGQSVNTLWGELAWQLLGAEGVAMVANSDASGTSPGKDVLTALLQKAAPCVVLMDELVAFIRQLEFGQSYAAGTFDSNISFIQALTEAMKLVPNAMLLASLPESEMEVGGTMGKWALDTLEANFARLESVWKPVATEEAFNIVRQRLFEDAGAAETIRSVCQSFLQHYRDNAQAFPTETQSNDYLERMCRSYPIHPEIFDRLYEDWATLDNFQRTRGVLQYLAFIIHRLWNSDNRDALIMPGSIPMADANVLNKSIHYLPGGWQPVIEREVDGERSQAQSIDAQQSLFGSLQAARRTTRTIFLGTAPGAGQDGARGLKQERILLGAVQAGQSVGVFADVLKKLHDELHYLYADPAQGRYWFDTKPNLRREMESRKQQINPREQLLPLLKEQVEQALNHKHSFAGLHVFTAANDVPDELGSAPRLVVLPPDATYSRSQHNEAYTKAKEMLQQRGNQPRHKQNRLLFLAPDFDTVGRLREQGKAFLAWKSIVDDIENGRLNHDMTHLREAQQSQKSAKQTLAQMVRETYKWVLAPVEEIIKGHQPKFSWEVVSITTTSPNLVQSIEDKLSEEELVAYQWSPFHLKNLLSQWYFKNDVTEVNARQVWQDTCHYLYMPRLQNEQVFINAIAEGIKSQDFFAYASGKEQDKYLGFTFGQQAPVTLDDAALLIECNAATNYLQQLEAAKPQPPAEGGTPTPDSPTPPQKPSGEPQQPPSPNTASQPGSGSSSTPKKHFYGTTTLNPIKAQMDFSSIMEEVVQHFTANMGVEVQISIEIEATSSQGFDETLQRTIKENCDQLKFKNHEFGDE